jgi:hypothetical protein
MVGGIQIHARPSRRWNRHIGITNTWLEWQLVAVICVKDDGARFCEQLS